MLPKRIYIIFILLCAWSAANAQISNCPGAYIRLPTLNKYDADNVYCVKVKYKQEKRLAVADVMDFYQYFKKYKKLDNHVELSDELYILVYEGYPLKITVPFDSVRRYFEFTSKPNEADSVAAKGEKYFLNYYFTERGCKRYDRDVSDAALMKHLQNWCILAFRAGETGCLHLSCKMSKLER